MPLWLRRHLINNCQVMNDVTVHQSSKSLLLFSFSRRRYYNDNHRHRHHWNTKRIAAPSCYSKINDINHLITDRQHENNFYRFLSTNIQSSSSSSSSSSNSSSGFNISSLPKVERLQSATGRARKRRRRVALRMQKEQLKQRENNREKSSSDDEKQQQTKKSTTATAATTNVYAYPKGRPWLVLWPDPYKDDPNSIRPKYKSTIPHINDIRNAWSMYMETWEDGLRGPKAIHNDYNINKDDDDDSKEEEEDDDDFTAIKEQKKRNGHGTSKKKQSSTPTSSINLDKKEIGENLKSNIKVAKDTSNQILQHAKDTTGIKDTRDLKKVAEDIMQLLTDCLKEFMAGYRKGRDDEIDNMLNEYFKDEEGNQNQDIENNNTNKSKRRRKRKWKRAG